MRAIASSESDVNRVPLASPSSAPDHAKFRFFDGLAQRDINSIVAAATLRQYPAHSVLANQSEPADFFFLLRTGGARLFFITRDGRKVLLRWLAAGELLGGAALMPNPSLYIVGTEMVKSGSVYVWHRSKIRELTSRYPKLLDNGLPFAMDHLTWFLAAQLALISKTARERLAQVLLGLAEGIGRREPDGIHLDITNEQLANTANITPFTASRILSEWQRKGTIRKGRCTIVLNALDRLLLEQTQI